MPGMKTTQLDFQHWPAINFRPEVSASPPEGAQPGQFWYNPLFDTLCIYRQETDWQIIPDQEALDAVLTEIQTSVNELPEHLTATHNVHGIADTSALVVEDQISRVGFTGLYADLIDAPVDDIPSLTVLFDNGLV